MSRPTRNLRKARQAGLPFLAASLLLPFPGYAQTNANAQAFEQWKCALCVGSSQWLIDIETGPAFVGDDAYVFGDHTGLDAKGSQLFADYLARYRGAGGSYTVVEGYTRDSDAYAFFANGGKQGAWRIRSYLQSIPRRLLDETRSPFSGVGSAELMLPANWVAAPTTGQMTALPGTAAPVDLGYDRNRLGLGLDYSLPRDAELSVHFRRQQRQGVARSSGAILFSALEFASPIDYETNDVEVAVAYSKENWQASASYFGSKFSNDNPGVTWSNPYSAIRGADEGRQALAPDNEAHRIMLAGSALLPARTTVNGHLAIGRLKQNSSLLPFTVNPTLSQALLPTPTANAEVDTLTFNLRAVSSPWTRLSLTGEVGLSDFDNTTPANFYDYIVTDVQPSAAPATSTAYDYQRRTLKFSGEYRFASATRLTFGVDTERFDRNMQDRRETTTDRIWARLRQKIGGVSELNLDVFGEDRGGSSYETVLNPATPENPLMRKYNMADRQRDGVELRFSYFGAARAEAGIEIEASEDRYDEGLLGLTRADYRRIGANVAYVLGDSGSIYASLDKEQVETTQASSQSFSLPDWAATTDDEFMTATVGAAYPELFGRVDAESELVWSHSTGKISSNTSGVDASLPELRNRRRTARVGLSYALREHMSVGLDYFVETLSGADWALDGVDPATVPSLLALGAAVRSYDTNVVFLSLRYRLGT